MYLISHKKSAVCQDSMNNCVASKGHHSSLSQETTTFNNSLRSFLRPEAATVCCGWMPQPFKSLLKPDILVSVYLVSAYSANTVNWSLLLTASVLLQYCFSNIKKRSKIHRRPNFDWNLRGLVVNCWVFFGLFEKWYINSLTFILKFVWELWLPNLVVVTRFYA